jgi:hypothetical protein
MKTLIALALAAAVAGAAVQALAHHSGAMFDRNKEVTLVGTLKEVQFIAPHGWIEMLVPDPKTGKSTEWSIETAPTGSRLFTMGFSRTSPGPGEKITLIAHPLRDGRPGGSLVRLTTADGRVLPQRAPNAADAVAPAGEKAQ